MKVRPTQINTLIAAGSRRAKRTKEIIDDILDIEGDQELLGKKVGSDSKKHKATYPGVVGLKQAHKDASRLIAEAVAVLDDYEENMLKHLANYIAQRRN